MCCIIVCPPKHRPSFATLKAVALANPHGAGIAWREKGAVQYLKTDDVAEIHRTAQRAKGDIVIHFRIASVGGICAELRHPFPVTHKAGLSNRSSAPAVLFQNGTWGGWRVAIEEAEADGFTPPTGQMSDARAAAWLCHVRGEHRWLERVWSRWVFFSTAELRLYGDWHEQGGMFFSNLHWCGRDTSTPPHLQTCPSTKPAAKAAAPKRQSRSGQLWFQPSAEFLETARRIRSRCQ